jgi:hypothetical protein
VVFQREFHASQSIIDGRGDEMNGSPCRSNLQGIQVRSFCTSLMFSSKLDVSICKVYARVLNLELNKKLLGNTYKAMKCVSAPEVRTNSASDDAKYFDASSYIPRK